MHVVELGNEDSEASKDFQPFLLRSVWSYKQAGGKPTIEQHLWGNFSEAGVRAGENYASEAACQPNPKTDQQGHERAYGFSLPTMGRQLNLSPLHLYTQMWTVHANLVIHPVHGIL
jgi:hypothetical protein